MDEGRRNFLAYQIISAIKFITLENIRYKLISPSKELRLLAEHIYQETARSLRFDNFITDERATLFLRGLGIWGPEGDESLKKLEKHLEDKKVDLYKALYDAGRQERIKKTIEHAKKSINNALSKKHSLDYMTLNFHAMNTKKRFLTAMCLVGPDGDHIYDEKSFWNSDSRILEQATSFLELDIITIEEIRDLARNDPWRTIWNLGKESSLSCPSSEYTEDQRMLVTFSKMYDNAYQSMECPPDEVFEDDDMFDGWLIDQRRSREKEQKQKQIESVQNVPDSAQEVFVFAPTREDADKIYNLNSEEARMKIKAREQFIENHGTVEAQDLPDTQLELRQQQLEEYKAKLKGGR